MTAKTARATENATGDLVTLIIRFESGEMTQEEVIEFFQTLVNNGLAWQLQGMYGRTAQALIEDGYINPPQGRQRKV